MHSLSATYGIFKDNFNVFFLHKGITRKKQLESLFESLALETSKFHAKDFIEMYKSLVGLNIDDYDEREQYRYNFLMIYKDPVTMIYRNFDKRLK